MSRVGVLSVNSPPPPVFHPVSPCGIPKPSRRMFTASPGLWTSCFFFVFGFWNFFGVCGFFLFKQPQPHLRLHNNCVFCLPLSYTLDIRLSDLFPHNGVRSPPPRLIPPGPYCLSSPLGFFSQNHFFFGPPPPMRICVFLLLVFIRPPHRPPPPPSFRPRLTRCVFAFDCVGFCFCFPCGCWCFFFCLVSLFFVKNCLSVYLNHHTSPRPFFFCPCCVLVPCLFLIWQATYVCSITTIPPPSPHTGCSPFFFFALSLLANR